MNRNDRSIVGLVMVAHAMVHTYELSIPILVTIWLDRFGVGAGTMGIVVSAGYALFGLGALPGGLLADAYGSRRLIIACLAGMGGSFVLLSLAPTVPVIALALVLWGVAASVYHPSGLSLISKGVSRQGTAFAYHGMAGNLGIALGPLATAVLLLFFDWRVVVVLLAAPAALAILFALTVEFDETAAVEESVADGGERTDGSRTSSDQGSDGSDSRADGGVSSLSEFVADSKTLFTGAFALVFGVVMFSGLYYRGALTFLPEMLANQPLFDPVAVGSREIEPSQYVYAGLLMIGIGGQYVGGKLTDRIRVERGITGAFAALAVIALLYVPALNGGLATLLAASAVLGFALFVVQPLYQAAVAQYTPAGTRGLSYGFTYLGVFGIGALGAGIAGYVLELFSPTALFVVLAGFALAAAGFGAVLSVRSKSSA
ncbi:MFS transporter [Halorussus salilacus]|uniref:MFS transporter n=1 Tax=Halorussus salilacus TaxID=2953750 RepID=UPI0020A112E4|nr:MFS transporter [Halorussus salilacus]USZ68307.1 MFS transporter [Halorussus salilacus]